ncbi:MAG: hypothetical protein WBB01_04685 [Phormidesmis sp.]
MTISHRPSVCTGGQLQSEEVTPQQRLSAAEATADKLDLPDWSQLSDGIYRYGYIVMLRTRALQWKVQATSQAAFTTWRYCDAARTLFVQIYVPGQTDSLQLRGEIQSEQSCAAINIIGIGNSLQVGQYLGSLGDQWADWRLVSLEVADEPRF